MSFRTVSLNRFKVYHIREHKTGEEVMYCQVKTPTADQYVTLAPPWPSVPSREYDCSDNWAGPAVVLILHALTPSANENPLSWIYTLRL